MASATIDRSSSRERVDEHVEAMLGLHSDICARQRRLLDHILECDRTEAWRRDGCRDMAQWLSGHLGITQWAARRWVHAAYALVDLPKTSAALACGVLNIERVVELARFATPRDEEDLIAWARRVPTGAIRRRGDLAEKALIQQVQDADRARSLRWWHFDDGRRMGLYGEFPAAEGAAIASAIKRLADRLPEMPDDDLPEGMERSADDTLEERCADALWAMASRAISQDSDADRATVVVHTRLDPEANGELEDGTVLHPETCRRLSCDARLQFVLTDADGNASGIGRSSRGVPPWLMRQLRRRDFGCTFPGCGSRAFLQAHHVWHWEHGGPTDLDNLVLTCHFHHKLVHEHHWGVALVGTEAHWYRPGSGRYDPGRAPPGETPGQKMKYQLTNKRAHAPSPAADAETIRSRALKRSANATNAQNIGHTTRRNRGMDMNGRPPNTRRSGTTKLMRA
jgi:hypothetical protein